MLKIKIVNSRLWNFFNSISGWVSQTSNERIPAYGRGNNNDDYQLSRGLDSVLRSGSKDGQMAKMAVPVVILMILVAIVVPIMHQRRQKMKQDLQKVKSRSSYNLWESVISEYIEEDLKADFYSDRAEAHGQASTFCKAKLFEWSEKRLRFHPNHASRDSAKERRRSKTSNSKTTQSKNLL